MSPPLVKAQELQRKHGRAQGFSLLELLVVLVIIGSLSGLALLVVGQGDQRQVRAEAERFALLMGVLLEEATLDNREYAVQLYANAYQVLRYQEQQGAWQALRLHRLPQSISLSLTLEGRPVLLTAGPTESQDDAKPHVLLHSSGELSVFELQLVQAGRLAVTYRVLSDGVRLPVVLEPETR